MPHQGSIGQVPDVGDPRCNIQNSGRCLPLLLGYFCRPSNRSLRISNYATAAPQKHDRPLQPCLCRVLVLALRRDKSKIFRLFV